MLEGTVMLGNEPIGQGLDIMQQGHGVRMQNLINPPLIKEDTAVKIAEIMLRDRWGNQRANEQLPLSVEDKGIHWRLIGGWLNTLSASKPVDGQFCMLIRKMDGLMIDTGIFHGPGGLPE